MKYNWFVLQYGREKESHQVLIYHPTPHSVNRFLSHFDDAIGLAANRLIREGTTTHLSDFLLSELAIEEMNRFLYEKVQPEAALFIVDESASFDASIPNDHELNSPISLTIEQSGEGFNALVLVQLFNGFYHNTIWHQLYDVGGIPFETLEKNLGKWLGQINDDILSGNLNDDVDLFLTVEGQFGQINAKAIPVCDVFISCTHQISLKNFQLLGEETLNQLLDLVVKNKEARKQNFDFEEEDLPF
jgi:hypothetical protein